MYKYLFFLLLLFWKTSVFASSINEVRRSFASHGYGVSQVITDGAVELYEKFFGENEYSLATREGVFNWMYSILESHLDSKNDYTVKVNLRKISKAYMDAMIGFDPLYINSLTEKTFLVNNINLGRYESKLNSSHRIFIEEVMDSLVLGEENNLKEVNPYRTNHSKPYFHNLNYSTDTKFNHYSLDGLRTRITSNLKFYFSKRVIREEDKEEKIRYYAASLDKKDQARYIINGAISFYLKSNPHIGSSFLSSLFVKYPTISRYIDILDNNLINHWKSHLNKEVASNEFRAVLNTVLNKHQENLYLNVDYPHQYTGRLFHKSNLFLSKREVVSLGVTLSENNNGFFTNKFKTWLLSHAKVEHIESLLAFSLSNELLQGKLSEGGSLLSGLFNKFFDLLSPAGKEILGMHYVNFYSAKPELLQINWKGMIVVIVDKLARAGMKHILENLKNLSNDEDFKHQIDILISNPGCEDIY